MTTESKSHGPGYLLTVLIVAGMVLGGLFGQFVLLNSDVPVDGNHWTKVAGDLILIRPLTMLVIPLVLFSVVAGVSRIGDPAQLGRLGLATLAYYFGTMLLAVILGTALVSMIAPGTDLSVEAASSLQTSGQLAFDADADLSERLTDDSAKRMPWSNILYQLVPSNLFEQMVMGRPLGIIVFSLGLGVALAAGREKTKVAREFFDAGFEGLMVLVSWVIWLTPLGVFFLVAWTVGKIGLGELFAPIGGYMAVVLLGLLLHGALVLPLILKLLGGSVRPYRFMSQMKPALLTAFGTDSSSATLPVTIETAESVGECSQKASNFVLPLGSTINMDGTALYEAVAVVFLFQLFGIDLSLTQLFVVVITATLAAVGAAGIPSAGLVTMVIVIAAVNASLPADVPNLPIWSIGIILGVDRILDMCRTTVNVWGDAVGARIMTRLAPD
jgi:Na+/H+-dicarboxylate symporter